MPFSKEAKALTTNFYQFKKYGSRKIVTKFSKINYKKEELDTMLKRFGKHEAPTGMKAAERSTRVLDRT